MDESKINAQACSKLIDNLILDDELAEAGFEWEPSDPPLKMTYKDFIKYYNEVDESEINELSADFLSANP